MSSGKPASSRFRDIQSKCLAAKLLYEDPEFPAVPKSVYFSKTDTSIQWRRPGELCRKPSFIDGEGASRFDLDQGSLGNCWFVAAAATLACHTKLFNNVVPGDQGFDQNYAGVFHFNFWCYGEWREVIIDDRLPTYKGRQLVFCSHREKPDEFWPALLEKAYAKLCGSYEAMDGGWTEDGLVDFTGGIGQRIDLTKKKDLPPEFFNYLVKQDQMSSLMGSSINATKETMENQLSNGLIIGHAYSITRVLEIPVKGKPVQLLRLRNPWGKKEWNGAWGDRSKEWLRMDPQTRQDLGLITEEDGEFWMSFEDWLANFHTLQMCYLPPTSCLQDRHGWKELQFNGSWVPGVNSGGSGQSLTSDKYWANAQYCVTINARERSALTAKSKTTAAAATTDSGPCTMIVSLMQKNNRRNRTVYRVQSAEVAMTFDLYRAKTDTLPSNLSSTHYDKYALQLARRGEQYQYYREISYCFHVEPAVYVVIPSTYDSRAQAEYLLRIYTETWADGSEMDAPTEPIRSNPPPVDNLQDFFTRYAGSDGVIDFRELQQILNQTFSKELGADHSFDLETCRSLLSMLDKNQSGVLEFNELQMLWTELGTWKKIFVQFDKDSSGYIDVSELKSVFNSIGYRLSRVALTAVVRRFGGKEGRLAFNDFVLAVTKIVSLVGKFPELSNDGLKGKAELSLDEFLQVVMYF